MRIEDIARTCHEVNRAYCLTLGDASHRPWEDSPDWQRASCIAGVRAIVANPLLSPAESHANWMEAKHADGWRWGPVKNETEKTHPCMVRYRELSAEQQTKDILFGAVCRSLIPLLEPAPAAAATS